MRVMKEGKEKEKGNDEEKKWWCEGGIGRGVGIGKKCGNEKEEEDERKREGRNEEKKGK